MNRISPIAFIVLMGVALAAAPASAARSQSGGMPDFRGEWHPVVGAGAVYQVEGRGQPAMTVEIAVVGQEAGGYWIENRVSAPEENIMKMLVTQGSPKRLIVKGAGQPAMELPVNMQAQVIPDTDLKQKAKQVGKEQVSTPAGTFSCDHYQMQERGTVDVWVTESVSPYGLVKMTSRDATMTLAKVVKGAKSRITETPQKLEIPQMPSLSDMMGGGRNRE